jgi:LysR family transcriptional regulator (chromosome initiation inhibitor)
MIDYKLVRALGAVVREGGFERAARALHLTQSAVSQRVKLLEEQAGRVLLVRSSPPRPTEAGRELLRHLRRVERLEGDLAESWGAPWGGGDAAGEALGGWDVLPVAVNADSLATWFLDAARPLLERRSVLLDVRVADQEETHRLLRGGEVAGCVSARAEPVQGCAVRPLGCMIYRLVAAPAFCGRWFPEGFTPEAAARAPTVIFDRNDGMHERMLRRAFGPEAPAPPAHYVPSSERFVDVVAAGLGHGMVPDLQCDPLLARGELLDLGPEFAVEVALHWHCWNIESRLLATFGEALLAHAGRTLARGE